MARRTSDFDKAGIDKLPNDKPVVYKILNRAGKPNYAGSAKRGRVRARLREHIPGGEEHIPGTTVQIEQMSSIEEAEAKEQRIISRTKPPYNKRGK